MEHFVTNFNFGFLPQGLALYRSMQRHLMGFQLWVVCMDQNCFSALRALNLPNLRAIDFSSFESDAYRQLRKERTVAEYCWTVNPLNPYLVFSLDLTVERVTYLDADLWFLRPPELIFEEFSNSKKAVLVTEHAYLPQYDQSASSGVFCAQWITFVRNQSESLRKWWEEQCFQWCFNRTEDGKFGDQKYMESWPTLFPDVVHSLSNSEVILAPWNAQDKNLEIGVAHHFHGLRIIDHSHYCTRSLYKVSTLFEQNIYEPYLIDLKGAIQDLSALNIEIGSQIGRSWSAKSNSSKNYLLKQLSNIGGVEIKFFNFYFE